MIRTVIGAKAMERRFTLREVTPTSIAFMDRCRNCENNLNSTDKYCSACGQQVKSHMDSVGDFVSHFLNDYFAYDSKLSASLRPLLFSPGTLTVNYINGMRVRYIPPMRMYIFISFLFFVVTSIVSSPQQATSESAGGNHDFFGIWLPRIFFLGLPVFALFQNWFFSKKGLGYVPAFVFSLHYHAFVFLSLTIYAVLSWTFGKIGMLQVNFGLFLMWVAVSLVYLFVALKRLYGRGFAGNLLRLTMLVLVYGFFITLLSMVVILFSE